MVCIHWRTAPIHLERVFDRGNWEGRSNLPVFGNCRFSFLPSDIDTRCTWSRYSPDLDTPWQTSRHAWRRAWLCEQPSTVKSWKTFLLSLFHLEYYLGLHSLLGPQVAVLFLPLPPLQDRLRHCRQFAFHSHPGFWKSYRWHKNRRRRRWSENWIAKQVRHCRRHYQGQPFFFLYNHRCALPLSPSKLFYCSSCDSLHEDCMYI